MTQKGKIDLTGLSIPQDNPYKKMCRSALIKKALLLHQQNIYLNQRLAYLQPHKQKQYRQPSKKKITSLFEEYKMEKFAIKIAYIGVSYNGLTIQKSTDNTIQAYLFKAMHSLGLVKSQQPGDDYTRAGRTDTGVSAFGNVVSLYLRTNEPISTAPPRPSMDYCRLINNLLPTDIRVLAVKRVPEEFNARYSCIQRSYKYFFVRNHLNIEAMREAVKMFEGTHNFLNFCRIDVVATTNYQRNITSSSIQKVTYTGSDFPADQRNQLYYFHFIANAFLWHQIRFMVTILFLVGSGKESPSIVQDLLDPAKFPRKPNYPISPEYPLILEECRYKDFSFDIETADAISLYNTFNTTLIKKMINLCLYVNCQITMFRWLSLTPHRQIVEAAQEQTFKMTKRKAGKKLNLHKSTCIGVQEAIGNLKGKRLELYEKRAQKQAEYEQRVRVAAQKQVKQGQE